MATSAHVLDGLDAGPVEVAGQRNGRAIRAFWVRPDRQISGRHRNKPTDRPTAKPDLSHHVRQLRQVRLAGSAPSGFDDEINGQLESEEPQSLFASDTGHGPGSEGLTGTQGRGDMECHDRHYRGRVATAAFISDPEPTHLTD